MDQLLLRYFQRRFPLFISITTMLMVKVLRLVLVLWCGSAILATVHLALAQDTQCSKSFVVACRP